jgi:AcrR family transcriptional regulator
VTDDVTRPQRADARRNRERILAVARTIVQEHGTDASLRDVARSSGVGLGTLYRHFPTRQDLLVALLHDLFHRFAARAAELHQSAEPRAAMTIWLREYLHGAAPYRGFASSMMETIFDPQSALFTSCTAMRDAVAELLARGQESGDFRTDIDALDIFVLLNAVSWIGDQNPVIAHRQERLLDLMLDGLSTPAPEA